MLDAATMSPGDAWPDPDGEPCFLPPGHPLCSRYTMPRRFEVILPPRQGMLAVVQKVPGSQPGQAYEMVLSALPVHQVVVALEGWGERYEARMDGRTETMIVRPGDLCVIPAGVESRWIGRTSHAPFMVLDVGRRWLEEIAADAGRAGGPPDLAPRVGQHDAGVAALADALRIEHAGPGVSATYAEHWCLMLGLRLLRLDLPEPRRYALTPRRLAQVRDYAEAHLADDIGLDDLAASVGLSRFHFARAFRHETGTSPSVWLRMLRCERARALLAGSDMPVQTVARACGFVSPAHFSNAFRAAFGMTPSRWRAEHRR